MCRSEIGSRKTSWNALLLRLESIHFPQGSHEFPWKILSVFYVQGAIQPQVPVDNNNSKIWKMKNSLKTKLFA
jgi:hypothetical protein